MLSCKTNPEPDSPETFTPTVYVIGVLPPLEPPHAASTVTQIAAAIPCGKRHVRTFDIGPQTVLLILYADFRHPRFIPSVPPSVERRMSGTRASAWQSGQKLGYGRKGIARMAAKKPLFISSFDSDLGLHTVQPRGMLDNPHDYELLSA
jgi:hypothetical protein